MMLNIRKMLLAIMDRPALVVLVLLLFLLPFALAIWHAPSDLDTCMERAWETQSACVQKAKRARSADIHSHHATGQGGRVTGTAREGQFRVCAERFELETQACESRFSDD